MAEKPFINRIDTNKKKTKVMFYGDSPTCATGFGQVSRNILPALRASGKFDVDILGINYWGDPHDYPFRIWPMAINPQKDPYGRQRMQQHLLDPRCQFDILFFLQDTFILEFLPQLLTNLKNAGKSFKSVFYYPIDGIPKENWIRSAASVDVPVTYTQFGYEQSVKLMPELKDRLQIIPHGANPKVFYPVSKEDAMSFRNQYFGGLADRYIFANVNRNQQRKDIPATIRAFKEFQKQRPNSLLYLHMAAVDQGWNLPEVIKSMELDITKDVILPQKFTPSNGFPLQILNLIYNAVDAVISTTVGEGWGLCLDGETRVATTRGQLPINTLTVEDRVVVGGKDFAIRGVASSTKDKVYKITLFGNKELVGSAEHRIPTADRGYVGMSEISEEDRLVVDKAVLHEDSDYVYDLVEYADSHDNHYVWNKMGFSPKNTHSIKNVMKSTGETKKVVENAIRVYLDSKSMNSNRVEKVVDYLRTVRYQRPLVKLPRFITFNPDLARLMGYYVAEGSSENGVGVEFAFNRNECDYHQDVQDLMYKFFGLDADLKVRENKCEIRYRSSVLSKFFTDLCGTHATNKHIPVLCLQHRDKAAQFIRGYWRGDGHLEDAEFSFCTSSNQLMEELTWLLTGFNIFSKVNLRPVEKNIWAQNDAWSIYVNGEDYNLLAEVLGIADRHYTFKKRNYLEKTERCFIIKVKSSESYLTNPDKLFWDISVGGVEHFVANGIVVHNSWTEAMAVGKPVIFPNNTCLGQYITDETGFPYSSGGDPDHLTIIPNDNEVLRPVAHVGKMVERMLEVYDNPEETRRRAEAAYRMITSSLVWDEHINPRWVSLFDGIADSIQRPDVVPTTATGDGSHKQVLKGEIL